MDNKQKLKVMFIMLKDLKNLKDEMDSFKRKRSCAVRLINRDRNKLGFYTVSYLKMKEFDVEQFLTLTRMTLPEYTILLNLIQTSMEKKYSITTVTPENRLAVTLLYLSQGGSVQGIAWSFKLGKETVRQIILETCDILWNKLSEIYVSEPDVQELEEISKDFWHLWNLPNCLGAIDGKHIAMKCPPNSGSQFYNYKHFFSIVLLAAVDARYTFRYIDVGAYGSQSDGGVFQASSFGKRLLGKKLHIPPPKRLPGTAEILPQYFVADAAFPLGINLMKPYGGANLRKEEEIFNKRLSRARRVVENAFGILVVRWRILLTTIHMIPDNATKVVLACISLHNFLRLNRDSQSAYMPDKFADWEDEDHNIQRGQWRDEIENNLKNIHPSRNSHIFNGKAASRMRDKLLNFLNNEGALEWQ